MGNERGSEPYRQWDQRQCRDALKPPLLDAVLCRAEPKCAAER